MTASRNVLVLGASGLIGRFLTDDLRSRSFQVTGLAREFTLAQRTSPLDLELPIMAMDRAALAQLLGDQDVDVVVNCLGVLQDGPGSDTAAVHREFVHRLLEAINASGRAIRLIHISIPGSAKDDLTDFSRTKREAEQIIAASGLRYAILRPGFVIAPAAFGGSAMVRALAALPVEMPAADSSVSSPSSVSGIDAAAVWSRVATATSSSTMGISWNLT